MFAIFLILVICVWAQLPEETKIIVIELDESSTTWIQAGSQQGRVQFNTMQTSTIIPEITFAQQSKYGGVLSESDPINTWYNLTSSETVSSNDTDTWPSVTDQVQTQSLFVDYLSVPIIEELCISNGTSGSNFYCLSEYPMNVYTSFKQFQMTQNLKASMIGLAIN